jgi:microcystin-dependent protein
MAYGSVKVDTIIFDNSGSDQNVTVSGLYRATTSGLTVSGTLAADIVSGVTVIGSTTVSGATVTGTVIQGTTVQGVSGTFTSLTGTTGTFTSLTGTTGTFTSLTGTTGTFTSLTGTTTTGTTANFISGVFSAQVSGQVITGNTGQFTSGNFVSLVSTTGSFTSITGATVVGTTGTFTSLTGTTTTGTTANFISGVFTTQVSGTTVTGTTSSFTNGNFATLSGATTTFTSGITASGTVTNPSLSFQGDPNTGIYSPGADQLAVATNGVERVEFGTTEVVFNDGGADIDFRIEGDTKANLFKVDAGADTVIIDGLTHPSADGTAGQSLVTDGSGVLSVVSVPPPGSIIWYAANSAPTGYLKANGANVNRTTYADLFTAIGTTFGVGDGSTTFTLPDLRGEFPRGWDDGRGIDSGRAFGSAQADALKSHSHTIATRATVTSGGADEPPLDATGGAVSYPTSSTGGAETRPRNIALLAIIKF